MGKTAGQELVVGLIGAVGTPLDIVESVISRSLGRVEYGFTPVRLSSLLPDVNVPIKQTPEDERIGAAMTAGTQFRETLERGDALAALAVGQIRIERGDAPRERHCYVLRSLKHPAEVDALRSVYGDQFIAVAVHAPREERVLALARRIAETRSERSDDQRGRAEELIARDENERGHDDFGQQVRDTFPRADVFLTTSRSLETQIDRFVDLLFGRPVVTPTRDEVGMFHAQGSALRSSAMGRQVGAALLNKQGDLLAIGCNEVPKAGGGQYWEGDEHDGRDFQVGFDQSDVGKRGVLRDMLFRLKQSGHLREDANLEEVVAQANKTPLREAAVLNLTEFTRDVHAESAAIVTAARLGRSVRRSTLCVTTFPCHNCAKHILAAGVSRVVYIEPYAKSYAAEFYRDSIELEQEHPKKVSFLPFSGIAPRRFLEWFRARNRKASDGRVIAWRPELALPSGSAQLGLEVSYQARELALLKQVEQAMRDKGLGTA